MASTKTGQKNQKPVTARIGRFLREVQAELKKVAWPNRKELTTYTLVVIASVLVIAVFTGVIDFVFAQVIELLRKIGR